MDLEKASYIELTYFSLFLPRSTTKNPGHYILNKCKKTLKDREKKADCLGILGTME